MKATKDNSAKGGTTHTPSVRPQDAQVHQGHYSENGQQDRTSDNNQSVPQGSNYNRGVIAGAVVNAIVSMPTVLSKPPPKDKYQQLKEEYDRIRDENKHVRATIDNYDRELRRKNGELSKLQHEVQQSRDTITGLQNELNNVYQQLEDAKTLSEARGKELAGSEDFLTKADTLSISEVGEKVSALNEEIFQVAATLGEALVHRRYKVSQKDLEEATVIVQEIVGEKMTKILITQSLKPESEVNPLLVHIVLQISMIMFCVSKIQSWYPNDETIGGFLSAIYSEIRSTGKHRTDSNTKSWLTYNTL